MFFKSILEFKKEFDLDIYQWNILCLIYSFESNNQSFFMSLSTISSTLDICKNTAIKSLKVLEEKGLITKEVRNSGKNNVGNIYKCTNLVHNMNKVYEDLVHEMNQPSSRHEQAPSSRYEHNNNNYYTNSYTKAKKKSSFANYTENNQLSNEELKNLSSLKDKYGDYLVKENNKWETY